MTVAALVNEWQFGGKRIAIMCNGIALCRCLISTAIASASKPESIASAMKKSIEAGREAYFVRRMAKKLYTASPS
jgi:thiazole synthase ThiGH ThiG subunit